MDILNSILDNIDEAVVITDREGGMLFFNQEAAHITSTFNPNPLKVGEKLVSYVTDARRPTVEAILQEITEHKKDIRTWAEYTQLNGLSLHLELKYIPVLDDEQKISYINVLAKDITSHKIFEKKIKAQATNVESLIQKANAVIFSTDSRGYITTWNDHCTEVTGYQRTEVFAKRLAEVVLPEAARNSFTNLIEHVLNMEIVANHETKVRTKDGRMLTFLLSATPQLTTMGQAVGITFVGQDITELIEYRKSLEHKIEERTVELRLALQKEKALVEMKSRFVAMASHEFRTPLSSIQFAANFLKNYHHRIEQKERNHKLDNIVNHVSHMASLLDDVLTYGKNDAGKINLVTSRVNVEEFVSRICEESGYTTRNSHAVVQHLDNIPEEIITDEKLLRSILSNLVTNAIKFSPGKDKVIVTVSGIDDKLELTVKDDGIGIPEDELENIFEPFLRGKDVSTIQGTGLGLSITKKAVELLGGTLHAESRPGIGTVFKVRIPQNQ